MSLFERLTASTPLTQLRARLRQVPLLADGYRTLEDQREQRARPRVTPFGFRLATRSVAATGGFEPEETAVMLELFKTAEVLIDVGANIGFYTCLARSRGLDVVAVEPSPGNLLSLYRNLTANGYDNVAVLPVALGSNPGVTELYGGGTGASLVREWAGAKTRRGVPVPLHTADAVLLSHVQGRRAVIKLDVEGAEYGVLLGAAALLATTPRATWMIEVDPGLHHPGGRHPDFEKVFDIFFQAGYRIASLPERREVTADDVSRWARSGVQDFGSFNFLCE